MTRPIFHNNSIFFIEIKLSFFPLFMNNSQGRAVSDNSKINCYTIFYYKFY